MVWLERNEYLASVTMNSVSISGLKIAHPFAPFVTETIWQTLNYTDGILMRDHWPTPEKFDPIAAEQFEQLKTLVAEGR